MDIVINPENFHLELDEDTIRDVLGDFQEHRAAIEEALNALIANPGETELLHSVFRSVHSVKSNAAVCEQDRLVDYIHALEDVITALRAGRMPLTELVAECLMLTLDHIGDLHQKVLLDGEQVETLETIEDALQSLARSPASEVNAGAREVIAQLGGDWVEPADRIEYPETLVDKPDFIELEGDLLSDVLWFRELGQRVDESVHFWEGRSDFIARFAVKMNRASGSPLDHGQLLAGAYLHDVGMAFMPHAVINKAGKLSTPELKLMHQHPRTGYDMVRRFSGWSAAAQMVLAHHERPDGGGYPQGLSGDAIDDGASILAILDAYWSMTHARGDRPHKRSILRAVTEINSCKGRQFDARWVNVFINVVRQEARGGKLDG